MHLKPREVRRFRLWLQERARSLEEILERPGLSRESRMVVFCKRQVFRDMEAFLAESLDTPPDAPLDEETE